MKKIKVEGKLPKPRNPLIKELIFKTVIKHGEKSNKAKRRQDKVAFFKSIYESQRGSGKCFCLILC